MKFKLLRNEEDKEKQFDSDLYQILYNRGIACPSRYVDEVNSGKTSTNNQYDCHWLKNIDKATEVFMKHFEKRDPISVLVDTDVDGFTSAAVMINYIKGLDSEYPVSYVMHDRPKAHGLDDNLKVSVKTKLFIIPDAATNDAERCKYFTDKGVDILILDHHDCDKGGMENLKNDKVVIVNNQISKTYPNKNLSGVGIVYKFCKALDDLNWTFDADKYLDLVALGNISDVMDMRSEETRSLVEYGLNHITNNQFKALISAQEYSMRGEVSVHNVQWYISPVINGCIRFANKATKELLFRGFINDYEVFDYKKRATKDHSAEVIKENIYDRAARLSKNAKSRQDSEVKRSLESVINNLGDTSEDKVVVTDGTGLIKSPGITGLVAMRLADYVNKPAIIVMNKGGNTLGGSGRNIDYSPIEDLKEVAKETNQFSLAQGHPNAFGVQIDESNVEKAREEFNQLLSDVEFEKVYYVDDVLDYSELQSRSVPLCRACDSMKPYYGQGIPEPKFAVKNVKFTKGDIHIIGKNRDTIQINDESGMRFIYFRCKDSQLYAWLDSTWNAEDEVTMNLVGEPEINDFNGVLTPQFRIVDCELTSTKNNLIVDTFADEGYSIDDIWS